MANPETERIVAMERREAHWRRWGPYLSERQWGTVREDYSADGNAWDSFPFEMSHLRAYRWGEDGILGISDNHQRLCFAPAFWNGRDRILKERLFGLNGHEGNHGEDVKEVWFHLDNLPSHAYMKALYKYPQRPFPYDDLRTKTPGAARTTPNTSSSIPASSTTTLLRHHGRIREGDDRRYPDPHHRDNRGTTRAPLHVLPTLWFRNEWSWKAGVTKPPISEAGGTGSRW